jgi:hypothetical protein
MNAAFQTTSSAEAVRSLLLAATDARSYRRALVAAMALRPQDQLEVLELIKFTKGRVCPSSAAPRIGGVRGGPGPISIPS